MINKNIWYQGYIFYRKLKCRFDYSMKYGKSIFFFHPYFDKHNPQIVLSERRSKVLTKKADWHRLISIVNCLNSFLKVKFLLTFRIEENEEGLNFISVKRLKK